MEHLKFTPPSTVTFDFLGKDSMRYLNTVELDQRAYDNLKSFTVGKKAKEEIFSDLSTSLLNEHLKSLMPDLTAKVFRTYNASVTLEKELHKVDMSPDEHLTTKKNFYNAANREVAILCNHQRSIPKGHDAAIGKLRTTLESVKDDVEEMEDWIEEMGEKKAPKAAKTAREERAEARAARRATRLGALRAEAKTKKEKEKEARAKLRAAGKEVPESEEEDEDYGVKDKTRNKPTGQCMEWTRRGWRKRNGGQGQAHAGARTRSRRSLLFSSLSLTRSHLLFSLLVHLSFVDVRCCLFQTLVAPRPR